MKIRKGIFLALFFIFTTLSFADEISDAIEFFDRSTENFNEATELFNKANKLSAKGEDNLTIDELNELADLYTEATEKFVAAGNFQRKANKILADAGISLDEEEAPIPKPKPKPKPKPVLSEQEKAKKKAKSKAVAMRARAKAQLVMKRIEAEKERKAAIKKMGKENHLKFVEDGRGPMFRITLGIENRSSKLTDEFLNELNEVINVMKLYPIYYVKIESYGFDFSNTNRNMKLSKTRAKKVAHYLIDKDITKYEIVLSPQGNGESITTDGYKKNNSRIELVFFREEGYFRK